MVNVKALRDIMYHKDISVEELAKRINKDKATLYRRFGDPDSFTVGEIEGIARELEIEINEAMPVFFAQTVA